MILQSQTISPWPGDVNFAEVATAVVGANALNKGPLFNQDGMIAVSDSFDGDKLIAVKRADEFGNWEITLPPGSYMVTYFDITQLYLLQSVTVNVPATPSDGLVDIGAM